MVSTCGQLETKSSEWVLDEIKDDLDSAVGTLGLTRRQVRQGLDSYDPEELRLKKVHNKLLQDP